MKLSPAAIFLLSSGIVCTNADFNGLRRLSRSTNDNGRNLQSCSSITWSKTCKSTSGCRWQFGECTSTSPPAPPTTPSPTNPPTPLPTRSPLPDGVGFCSDGSGQCLANSDCDCGSANGSGATADDASLFDEAERGDEKNLFQHRRAHNTLGGQERALQVCDPNAKRKDCPAGCVWNSGCAYPTTSNPTKQPTNAPTPCACLGAPTQSPTTGPTPTTPSVTYVPGERTVSCDGGNLLLSTGLDCKKLTTSNQQVLLANGSLSTDSMHTRADGAAVIPHPTDGGWYYASNSEDSRGGVGTLRFDSNGDLVGYERTMDTTGWNCGGGRTPWNTWVSCEEDGSVGRCHEVDPHTGYFSQVNVVATGGNYESFAYDDQDPTAPSNTRYFVTEDSSDGALTRYTPHPDAYDTNSNYDILKSPNGVYEYLILNDNDMTFSWSTSLSAGRSSASAIFPRSEGIDVHDRILSFVAKRVQKLFTLDLELETWSVSSTASGAFDLEPDQLARVLGDGDILYFCEDGGDDCDIHGRDQTGNYFTIVEGIGYSTETTGLAFSPDAMFMYVAFQTDSNIYSFWRTDGLPFNGTVADTKYHSA